MREELTRCAAVAQERGKASGKVRRSILHVRTPAGAPASQNHVEHAAAQGHGGLSRRGKKARRPVPTTLGLHRQHGGSRRSFHRARRQRARAHPPQTTAGGRLTKSPDPQVLSTGAPNLLFASLGGTCPLPSHFPDTP